MTNSMQYTMVFHIWQERTTCSAIGTGSVTLYPAKHRINNPLTPVLLCLCPLTVHGTSFSRKAPVATVSVKPNNITLQWPTINCEPRDLFPRLFFDSPMRLYPMKDRLQLLPSDISYLSLCYFPRFPMIYLEHSSLYNTHFPDSET